MGGRNRMGNVGLPVATRTDCRYLGLQVNGVETVRDRRTNLAVNVHGCAVHGRCTPVGIASGAWNCDGCQDYEFSPPGRSPELVAGLADPLQDMPLPTAGAAWARRPRVMARHQQALVELATCPLPGPTISGERGIVYVATPDYLPMALLGCKMARRVSDLPIRVYLLTGQGEAEAAGVDIVGGLEVVPVCRTDALRLYGAWQLKAWCIVQAPWRHCLYLDADAYLVRSPNAAFDVLHNGARFVAWGDFPMHDAGIAWDLVGRRPAVPIMSINGGQLWIDRELFWRELLLAHWLNQHADYWYHAGYGDQDQWRIALAVTGGSAYSCGRMDWRPPALVGRLGDDLVVHRVQAKWFGRADDIRADHLPCEAEAWALHRGEAAPPPAARAAAVFSTAYQSGSWGHGDRSGGGSTPVEAQPYVDLVYALAQVGSWCDAVDLGCGDGYVTTRLQFDELSAVDVYEPHLTKARLASPEIDWLVADLDADRERLPSSTVALLKDVLHHWPNTLVRGWLRWALHSGKWQWLLLTYDSNNALPGSDCELGGYRPLRWQMLLPSVDWEPPVVHYLHKELVVLKCNDW